jgi:hypothetical protein
LKKNEVTCKYLGNISAFGSIKFKNVNEDSDETVRKYPLFTYVLMPYAGAPIVSYVDGKRSYLEEYLTKQKELKDAGKPLYVKYMPGGGMNEKYSMYCDQDYIQFREAFDTLYFQEDDKLENIVYNIENGHVVMIDFDLFQDNQQIRGGNGNWIKYRECKKKYMEIKNILGLC